MVPDLFAKRGRLHALYDKASRLLSASKHPRKRSDFQNTANERRYFKRRSQSDVCWGCLAEISDKLAQILSA